MRWGLLLVVLTCAAHAEEWERVAARDGVVVERRSVEGSSVLEVRATAHSPLPPAVIMATLWKQNEYPEFVPYLKRLDVLQDDGDRKLVYEQIRVPFVKDRDVTLRATRTWFPETGEYEVTSIAVPEGPSESPDYVRVRTNESHWRLVPNAGGTAVTDTIRTDPGGLVPAWIVNTVQARATAKLIRAPELGLATSAPAARGRGEPGGVRNGYPARPAYAPPARLPAYGGPARAP